MAITTKSCAVVGVGVLGTSLCRQLLESAELAGTSVTGITKSDKNHESIRQAVGNSDLFHLTTIDECSEKFCNVVFCAPPSGSEDYAADVKSAAENIWIGKGGGGIFAFTSSGSV